MTDGIEINELDQETRERLGINIPPSLHDIGVNLSVLGKVFTALKGLSDDEALQVLRQAQMYIISKQQTPDIESVGLPGDGLGDTYAPPIDWTLKIVAKVYNLKAMELKQRKRDRNIVEARQVAMYLLSMTNKYSLTHIGKAIGGRTPATVGHAFNTIHTRLSRETELQDRVTKIQRLLVGK